MINCKTLTDVQANKLNNIPTKKKIVKPYRSLYSIPDKYRGISYPRINMRKYIVVSFLYAKEKKYFAYKNFKNSDVIYVDGKKIGLIKFKTPIEMNEEHDIDFNLKKDDKKNELVGGKRSYTKFGKFLFKSWDWVDNMDVDRFIILYYPDISTREQASKKYFNDKKMFVCDGLDYDFIRVD